MAEYSKIARGSFTSNGTAQLIALPFQPTVVKMTNFAAYGSSLTASQVPWAVWDVSMGQGTAAVGYKAPGTPVTLSTGIVSSGGISTFAQGLALQYGPKLQIVSFDSTSLTVTTSVPHNLSNGDVVVFQGLYQTPTTGMAQICGIPFNVFGASGTTFTVSWPSGLSNYTSLSGSPAGATVMKVLNPYLYAPGVSFINGIANMGDGIALVTCTSATNVVVGQEVAFRIPAAYGSVELNSLPNTLTPGSPIYGYVVDINDSDSFYVNISAFGGVFTPFNANQPISSIRGLQFPQVIAVGDVNTGGWPYSGGSLYPSPVLDNGSYQTSSINGPAIQGAFINNTRQGFVIGNGNVVYNGTPDAASFLCGASGNLIIWEAMFTDFGS